MKTTLKRTSAAVIVLLTLCTLGIALRAQTDNQSDADNPLQPVAPGDIPETGAFFRLSDYLTYSGSLGPPWPFLMTNAPVYSLDGSSFLVDDAVITNDVDLANALSLLVQPQDQFSRRLMTANSIDPSDGSGTNSSGGFTNNAQYSSIVDTNGLWLEVPTNSLATAGQMSVVLHNTIEDELYDILTTTNLSLPLTNWTVEQTVYGLEGGITPAQLVVNGRANLFATARYAGSSDGSGLPDWWQQRYFGGLGVDPYALDSSGDGWNYEQDYLHGFAPGNFYTPPAVQNIQAHFDSSGNVIVTWQSSAGTVTNYTVYRDDFYLQSSEEYFQVGLSNRFVDTTFINYPASVKPITYYVVANYALGDSQFGNGVSPYSLVLNEQPNAQAYLGPDGAVELAVSGIPDDAEELEVDRIDWNPYDLGSGVISGGTNFTVPVSSFTNGPYIVPTNYVNVGPDGSSWYVKTVRADNSESQATVAGYFSATAQISSFPAKFNDASDILVQNAIFQIRAAGPTNTFLYYYAGKLVNFPTNYVTASLYDTQSGSIDGAGFGNLFSWSTSFALNYRYRNFAPSLTATLNGGVSIIRAIGFDEEFVTLNDPAAYYFSPTNTTALPGLLSSSDTTWIAPHRIPAALGISDSGNHFSIPNNITNYFGLRLLSVLAVYSNATNGLHADIIDSTHPLAHGSDDYYFYPQFDQPQLQTVGFFFSKTGDDNGSQDAAPGLTNFSTTNLQQYLVFGSSQSSGTPIEVAAFSKQVIVNGDTNKPVYISQYFDKAYKVNTNGEITSEETGVLSPYGTFLPSEPGKVALVTMPDQNGQRGTGIVQIVGFQFDVNHDGKMDLSYYGPDSSWRSSYFASGGPIDFWVNDNFDRHHQVDGGDEDDDDLKMAGLTALDGNVVPDCNYGVNVPSVGFFPSIPCKKDLEDYARLWIPGLASMVASLPTNYTVELWTTGSGSIRLFQAVEPGGSTNYLFDDVTASNQVAQSSALYVGLASSSSSTVFLSGRTNLTDYFIMCGASAGDVELHLTVLDQNEQSIMETAIYFKLKEVIDMYERWTVGERPNFGPSDAAFLASDGLPDYWNVLPFKYGENTDTNTPYILYVHGWNMETWEKDRFADAAFKRLYWLGYKGRFGTFRWPTDHSFGSPFESLYNPITDPDNYDNSEYNAWRSAAGLLNKLNDLNGEYPGHIYLLAHSMGNVVAGEALRLAGTNEAVNTYVASQAAVSAHTYDDSVADYSFTYLGQTFGPWEPNIYKDWFPTNGGGAANRINFYNTNDYALSRDLWELNQLLKPDQAGWSYVFDGYPYSGSQNYNPGPPDDTAPWNHFMKQSLFSTVHFDIVNVLTNRYEVMAYAAQSRSPSLGKIAGVLHFSSSVDLGRTSPRIWPSDPSGHNYGDHKWHSAEFRSNLMEQQNYWRTLLYTADGFNLSSP